MPTLASLAIPGTRLVVAFICLLLAASASAQTWTLAWDDEFNALPGSKIDSTKWKFDKGYVKTNNEIEYYCAPGDDAPCDLANPNAFLDGSHLVIQQRLAPLNIWTSARLKTQGLRDIQYGRVEASIQAAAHVGLSPTFWMLPTDLDNLGQPFAGSFDIMSNYPAIGPTQNGTSLRAEGYSGLIGEPPAISFQSALPDGGQVDTAFHLYGVIWSPGMMQFYIDDPSNVVVVETASDIPAGTTWPFNNPFYIVLNMAVGGDLAQYPDPGAETAGPMLVDYVRFYQAAPLVGPSMTASPININAGDTATTTVNLTSTSGTGLVYLACTGAPVNATCSIDTGNALNRSAVDFSTDSTASATLKIATTVPMQVVSAGKLPGRTRAAATCVGLVGAVSVLALVLIPRGSRKRGRGRRPSIVLVAAVLLLMMAQGCGGGNASGAVAVPGHYVLTISAYTVSGSQSTLSIPLTVN
jgi:beta-glucanase (GH16 family)